MKTEVASKKVRRTGASPGALPSVCPAALEAPSPCSVLFIEALAGEECKLG